MDAKRCREGEHDFEPSLTGAGLVTCTWCPETREAPVVGLDVAEAVADALARSLATRQARAA